MVSNDCDDGWIPPTDVERVRAARTAVSEYWRNNRPENLKFTPHGPEHFARVEQRIKDLISNERWGLLGPTERVLLTYCAWTHDIGMNEALYTAETQEETIRKRH